MISPNSYIYIQKEPKKKDAIRVFDEPDIPEYLKNTIRIEGSGDNRHIILDCTEGKETAPLGKIIAFERSENTQSGYNSWVIGDESRVIEKDGQFYAKPVPTMACPMGEVEPEWLKGADIERNEDGSFSIKTSWGVSTGQPGETYWVKYGENDGIPDGNILTISEESFDQYFLCTKDGQNICPLSEFDNRFRQTEKESSELTPEQLSQQIKEDKETNYAIAMAIKLELQKLQNGINSEEISEYASINMFIDYYEKMACRDVEYKPDFSKIMLKVLMDLRPYDVECPDSSFIEHIYMPSTKAVCEVIEDYDKNGLDMSNLTFELPIRDNEYVYISYDHELDYLDESTMEPKIKENLVSSGKKEGFVDIGNSVQISRNYNLVRQDSADRIKNGDYSVFKAPEGARLEMEAFDHDGDFMGTLSEFTENYKKNIAKEEIKGNLSELAKNLPRGVKIVNQIRMEKEFPDHVFSVNINPDTMTLTPEIDGRKVSKDVLKSDYPLANRLYEAVEAASNGRDLSEHDIMSVMVPKPQTQSMER